MKIYLCITLMIFPSLSSPGQDQKIRFSSVNQVGLLSGGKGDSWTLQTINGIKKDKWFAGVGVGIDLYRQRSIPLFIDIRRDVTNKKTTPFAYADVGTNFSWLNSFQRAQKESFTSSPGLFYNLGIGCKLSGNYNRGFIFSAGYSFKQVKEKVKYAWWPAPTPELESENFERYNYLYRRIVIKVGLQL